MKIRNVLSLCDGISVGRLALDKVGVEFDNYYASEIDKYPEAVSKYHYPDIIRFGDMTKWREWDIDWSSIDLILAGISCQSWSTAGKGGGLNDPRGQLLLDLKDIKEKIEELNPDVQFLFENVKMKKEFKEEFDRNLNCPSVLINSALVSAQNRQRNYWTKVQDIPQPEDKGIMLKDVLHEYTETDRDKSYCIDANYWKGASYEQYLKKSRRQQVYQLIAEHIVPYDKTLKILNKEAERGKIAYYGSDSQANRVYSVHDKSVTLVGLGGGRGAKTGLYLIPKDEDYLFGCITPDRINKRQNGQRFNDGKKFYTLTAQDRHGVLLEGYIRKLTPVECERLQTLPDGYTKKGIFEGVEKTVSNSRRYMSLGNSWTCAVIEYLLKQIYKENK